MKKIISAENLIGSIKLAEELRLNVLKINSINQLEKIKHLSHISGYCCLIENILLYMIAKINSKTDNDYWEFALYEEKRAIDNIFRENIEYEIRLTKNMKLVLLPIMKTVKFLSDIIIDHDWISVIHLIEKMQAHNNIIDFYIKQRSLSAIGDELAKRMDLIRRNYLETSLMKSKLIIINMQKMIIKSQIKIINFIEF